jgi:hypothetical protein
VAEGRGFGLVVGLAFLVLGGVVWWRGRVPAALVFAAVGSLLFLAGLAIPTHLGPVLRAWTGLAVGLSKVTTPVFMGIVYFGVLTPIGFVKRLMQQNALVHQPNGRSYWVRRQPGTGSRTDMARQF